MHIKLYLVMSQSKYQEDNMQLDHFAILIFPPMNCH